MMKACFLFFLFCGHILSAQDIDADTCNPAIRFKEEYFNDSTLSQPQLSKCYLKIFTDCTGKISKAVIIKKYSVCNECVDSLLKSFQPERIKQIWKPLSLYIIPISF